MCWGKRGVRLAWQLVRGGARDVEDALGAPLGQPPIHERLLALRGLGSTTDRRGGAPRSIDSARQFRREINTEEEREGLVPLEGLSLGVAEERLERVLALGEGKRARVVDETAVADDAPVAVEKTPEERLEWRVIELWVWGGGLGGGWMGRVGVGTKKLIDVCLIPLTIKSGISR